MAIYTAGTIAIGTGRTATGTGTSWNAANTGIRPGQTILVNTTPPQQFQITAVNSATSMIVTPAPTANISATKYAILVTDALSVDGLASQVAEAIIWFKTNLSSKASSGANSDITSLSSLSTALSVQQGGTGAKSASEACKNIGAFPANGGNMGGPLNVDGDIHGTNIYSDRGTVNSQAYSNDVNAHFWMRGVNSASRAVIYSNRNGQLFYRVDDEANGANGYQFVMNKSGTFQCASLTQTSDLRSKSNKEVIPNALSKLCSLTGYTYNLTVTPETVTRGAGVIAQDVIGILPEAVKTLGEGVSSDGEVIKEQLGVDYSALSALYVEAFKELNKRLSILEERSVKDVQNE